MLGIIVGAIFQPLTLKWFLKYMQASERRYHNLFMDWVELLRENKKLKTK